MNLIYSLIIAFAMYSKIPMPAVEWNRERMRYVFCFFPWVGIVTGACMLLWGRFGALLWGEGPLYGAGFVLIPILITGGIHLDGFLDTCDALSSFKSMEEKLEILKDSHAGAFAIIMGGCYFVLNYAAAQMLDFRALRLICIGYVLSRSLSALAVVTFKKAKNSGLVHAFSDMSQANTVKYTMIFYILLCVIALILTDPIPGICTVLFAFLCFFWYRHVSYSKFGGITGDLAGFFLQICELGMLLTVILAIHLFS